MNGQSIRFDLKGEKISPSDLRIGKLAEFLEAFEDLIVSVASENRENITKETISLSLTNIASGSIALEISSKLDEIVIPSYERISIAIKNNSPETLPNSSREPLKKIVNFLKQQNVQAELLIVNGTSRKLAILTPDFLLPKTSWLSGSTIIFGEIVRVGGVEPRVEIKTINGKTLYCKFPKELATQLGNRLYSITGLRGQAKWSTPEHEIVEFDVEGVTPYGDIPLNEALRGLGEIAGEHYSDIDDVTGYISSLRGEE